MIMPKKILVVLGPAGSGKSTQIEFIKRDFGYKPLSMGDALREETKKKTRLSKEIQNYIVQGKLVPLELASDLMLGKIKKEMSSKLLLDGFPRELEQAVVFDYFLYSNDYQLVGVININVHKKECIKRLMLRKRKDDTETAITKRLEDYYTITKKVIERYKEKGKLMDINGNKPIEDVYKEIKRKLKKWKI